MAFVISTSVMAETVTEPAMVDINGYSCYERDGEYWTILDGIEYLVVNLDDFTEVATENYPEAASLYDVSSECPIGRPPFGEWVYNGYVELTESNNYAYRDRCYLTYGDYYSPIFCFTPKHPNDTFTAKIHAEASSFDTYHIKIWTHNTATGWMVNTNDRSFTLAIREYMLFTGTTTQLVDGLGFRFISEGVRQQQLYYTVSLTF